MMRITNSMLANDLKRNMNLNLLRMDELQRQLSTNRKINKPSDDPAGVVKALRLRTNLTEGEQYLSNISEAASFMQTMDDSMNSMTEILQKIRELTVKGATGTNDKDANKAIADEIVQLNEQLKMVANATYGSKYIFAGTNVTETPYRDGRWIGNDQTLEVEVGVGVKMPINLKMRDYFMGRMENLDIRSIGADKVFNGLEAKELQEGKYSVDSSILAAAANSATAREAQSYLGSVDRNQSFFYYTEELTDPTDPDSPTKIPTASLGIGTGTGAPPLLNNSGYNASLQLEVKQVKTGVIKGEPRATLTSSTGLTPALQFNEVLSLKDANKNIVAIPNGDLLNHFTYTRYDQALGTGTLNHANLDAGTNTFTFDITNPAKGDTIEWNNLEIASDPPMPTGSKLCTAAGKEYTPIKMVFDGTEWTYDDKSRVTVDIKGHVYDAGSGDYKYVELTNVDIDMETGAGQEMFRITADKFNFENGTPDPNFPEDLVIWNSGSKALAGIDPHNPQIQIGDKTIISCSATRTTDNSQGVDFGYTFLNKNGAELSEKTTEFLFDEGILNDKTSELKFFTLNEETGLTYDGSISLITNTFRETANHNEPSTFDYKSGLFSYVNDLARKVTVGKLPQVGNELAGVDLRQQDILLYRATIGARINRLELQTSRLESTQESYTALLAHYEDANAAEVIMNLKMQENVYQSALAAGARIIQPSLVDFLR